MLLKLSPALVLLLMLGAASPLYAAVEHHAAGAAQAPLAPVASTLPLTDGEVKKVDKDTGKLTIKHGPITNLGMPAMTMAFRVKDPAMLDQVKNGDKIRFATDKVNGALTVIHLEPVGGPR